MSMVIRSFNNLHDNRVLRYCADFEAHSLHMDTQTEAGENVSVRFTGLLAHRFEDVIQDNILFGMDEITVDGFFEQYNDLLGGTILYGFPACCSIEELRERMDREHIRVFVIDASLGLCGFVLAQATSNPAPDRISAKRWKSCGRMRASMDLLPPAARWGILYRHG